MAKSRLFFIFFFLWSLAVFIFFHNGALDKSLRYTRVAEGNISRAVHHVWTQGLNGYSDILNADAKTWGRIRPVHWLYYQVPFILTMIRNGDLFDLNSKTALRDRINGDLQTHAFFLVFTLAAATGFISWIVYRIGGSWWILLLIPVYFASFESIHENLIVYYSDSQEIPQLLFVALYFFGIRNIFSGNAPKRMQEVYSTAALIMAYGTKETSIILFPMVSLYLLLRTLMNKYKEQSFRSFCIRHIIVHAICSLVLISLIFHYKTGAYVSENYIFDLNVKEHIEFFVTTFTGGVPIFRLLLFGGIIAFGLAIFKYPAEENNGHDRTKLSNLILLAILFSGLFISFWMINIPWRVELVKYYLPVHFFAASGTVLLQIIVYKKLSKNQNYVGAIIWIIGTSAFMLKDISTAVNRMEVLYKNHYEYREAVPMISKDIAASEDVHPKKKSVHIVSGHSFQEGALPFLRYLNYTYGFNISANYENAVTHIKARERNYFRIYPNDRPSVRMALTENLPASLSADILYLVYNREPEHIKRRLSESGFVVVDKWRTTGQQTTIEKYHKIPNG